MIVPLFPQRLLPALLLLALPLLAGAQNLHRLEYFFDTDPGFGLATNVPITPAATLTNFTFSASPGLAALPAGIHVLGVRAKDANGRWSETNLRPVLKINVTATLPTVRRVEYFVDTDPGFGQAAPIAITPAATLTDLPVAVSLTGLTGGIHTLYVRAKDELGKWSLTSVRPFLLQSFSAPLANVQRIEYFFDTDPGFGQATAVPFTPSPTLTDLPLAVDMSAVPPGVHVFYVRSKDAAGKWSLTNVRALLKEYVLPQPDNLVQAEFFLNTDPGFGNAIPMAITPPTPILTNVSLSGVLPAVPLGSYTLYLRAKDALGKWSLTNIAMFQVVLGLHDENVPETALRLFPNPSADGVYRVDWLTDQPPAELVVFDVLGRTVVCVCPAASARAALLDLSQQPKGTYYLRVLTGSGSARTFSLLRP